MKSIEFYKELYFREIDRKHQLNNDVNIPILFLSAIVSVQTFLYSNTIGPKTLIICIVFSSLAFLSGLLSLFFLFKSFSNLFKSHIYKELADANEYFDYEMQLIKSQGASIAEEDFFEHLKKEFADCAGHNFSINKKRTEDLSTAKKGIFISTIFTLFLCVTISISIYKNMPEEQKPSSDNTTQNPSGESKPQGPQSVYIQNGMQFPEGGKPKK